MLTKLLIGGVTLATVGYGIKQYCEDEGCGFFDDLFDEDSETQEEYQPVKESVIPLSDEDTLLNFYYYKVSLYETTMREFKLLYNRLENCNIGSLTHSDYEFDIEEIDHSKDGFKKVLKRILKYGIFMDKTSHLLDNEVYKLREILEVSVDYATFSEKDQETTQKACNLAKVIDALCHVEIVSEDGVATKDSKILLKSQKRVVKELFSVRDSTVADIINGKLF